MPKASLILFLFLAIAPCSHAETAKEKIESLIPYIGQYPPKFSNNQEFQEIKNKYLRIKLDLDHQLLSNPNNHEARYLRGWLFTLGHNMDHPPAWQGAKDDLEFFIANNKDNVDAKVLLAYHFVNSKPEYALVAENLFKESQCLSGNKPLERAQRGIFFAIYYQGKMTDAYKQAQLLKHYWPNEPHYDILKDTVVAVLKRTNTKLPKQHTIALPSCSKK